MPETTVRSFAAFTIHFHSVFHFFHSFFKSLRCNGMEVDGLYHSYPYQQSCFSI